MSKLFTPSVPAAPPPPPPPSPSPTAADPNTQKNLEDAAARERAARGRAATLLTSGRGDTSQATTAKSVLLGS